MSNPTYNDCPGAATAGAASSGAHVDNAIGASKPRRTGWGGGSVNRQGYTQGMTSLTTIKVSTGTRDRLREASRAAGISQAALIEQMLDAREEAAFWEALDAAPPYTDEEREEFRRGEAASLADAARLLEDEER